MTLQEQINRLSKNLEILVPAQGLEEKLKWSLETATPLRIKLGFDPTAPDLHLGHAVALKKLRQFQEFGHQVVVILGDFTACIGDPTGRNKTRPPLTPEAIAANAKTYFEQLSKILDLSKTEIHYNASWLDKMDLRQTILLISKITLAQIIQREDFHNRYKEGVPIHFHELLYPIMQGYDSLMINADLEMGGTDQLFNCLMGREIQHIHNKRQQIVACVALLRGTDGEQKMGKSLGNYIGLTDPPNEMYGKLMSIPDHLILEYARLVSDLAAEKINEMAHLLKKEGHNPMESKKEIAFDIVCQFYSKEEAAAAASHFYKQVQSRDEELIEYSDTPLKALNLTFTGLSLGNLCFALTPDKSKSEVRRLIEGGGVTLNGEKVKDPAVLLSALTSGNFKLKVGKRAFYHILIA